MLNQVFSTNPIVQELVLAAKERSRDKIRVITARDRQKISAKDEKGFNAAMYLGKAGDEEGCRILIDFDAKALDCAKGAAFGGHEELARNLIKRDSSVYPELCEYAAMGGQKKTTQTLLNRTRTIKSLDHVAICKRIATAAKRGGHAELEKNYIKLAKVREAKLTVDDEEPSSSSHSPAEVEVVEPSFVVKAVPVPAITATTAASATSAKPVELERKASPPQSAPPRKTIMLTEPIPTFPKKVVSGTTQSKPTESQSGQTNKLQSPVQDQQRSVRTESDYRPIARPNQPPAPTSYARPVEPPRANQPPAPTAIPRSEPPRANQPPAPTQSRAAAPSSVLPQPLQAQQSPPPLRFSAPTSVQASATQGTKRPFNPQAQEQPSLRSATLESQLAPKQVSSDTPPSVQQTTQKEKVSSPSRSDEEVRKSPITHLFQEAKKSRTVSPSRNPVEEGEVLVVATPSISGPQSLSEALGEIQHLKAKVSMLEIALRSKQIEVSELRDLITHPNKQRPTMRK